VKNDDASWLPEFWQFVERASDDLASPADLAAFTKHLTNNPDAQRLYIAHIQLQADIRLLCHSQQSLEKAIARIDERSLEAGLQEQGLRSNEQLYDSGAESINLAPPLSRPRSVKSSFLGRGTALSLGAGLALAAAVVLLIAVGALQWGDSKQAAVNKQPTKDVVKSKRAPASAATSAAIRTESIRSGFVARIIQSSDDLTWSGSEEPFDFLLRIKPREKLKIATGFVQLEFYSGAKILVRGPAVFQPLGKGSGRLESGHLTGEASNGNFVLKTPTAVIVDLGTAFGVASDANSGTDVVVFKGRVQAQSTSGGYDKRPVLDMTEGMAARFRSDGTTESNLKTDASQYTRTIPVSAANEHRNEICLIDVLAGGSGRDSYLAGSIAPFNGQRDFSPEGNDWMQMSHESDGEFHRVQSCPMVNGVFIPNTDGKQVPIDTTGRTIDLPENSGYAFGTLWAKRKESIQNLNGGPEFDFWGFRTLEGIVAKLKTVRNGLIGMHANMGVTFDLRTMELVHHRELTEFRGAVANIENFAVWPPNESPSNPKTRFADCRIYVDGDLRYSRLRFRREDGDEKFAVPLTSKDRFLTVVVTDGDTEFRFDHIVLIDPVIGLKEE
jgi:hypothetical protein